MLLLVLLLMIIVMMSFVLFFVYIFISAILFLCYCFTIATRFVLSPTPLGLDSYVSPLLWYLRTLSYSGYSLHFSYYMWEVRTFHETWGNDESFQISSLHVFSILYCCFVIERNFLLEFINFAAGFCSYA